MSPANADDTWQASNGNVVGGSVQFDYRGGSASQTITVPDGATVSITVNNTIANCIGNCTPIPDSWSVSIGGQSFSGNTAEVVTVSAQVSGQVPIVVSGIDRGFWAGWYGPVFSAPNVSVPVVEATPSPTPSSEPTSAPAPVVTPEPSSSPVAPAVDTQTVTSFPSPIPVETPTATASPSPVPSPSAEPTQSTPEPQPQPSSTPTIEPQPVQPTVQPSQPAPEPEPVPSLTPEQIAATIAAQEAAAKLAEEQRLAEEKRIAEEQAKVLAEIKAEIDAVLEEAIAANDGELPNLTLAEPEVTAPIPPVEVVPDTTSEPDDSDSTEQQLPANPDPVIEEPSEVLQPDTPESSLVVPDVVVPQEPPAPIIASQVDLTTLPPDTPVTLDNGVVITAEVAIAVELLQDPTELLSTALTDPMAALAALSNVGADLPPEVREKAEKVVVAAVIVGNIATSAALSAASPAASYRRKP